MKLFRTIQEDGLFGVADSLKRDSASPLSYDNVIRGMKWEQAIETFGRRGITEFQVGLIMDVQEKNRKHAFGETRNGRVLNFKADPKWPSAHTAAIKNLMRQRLVERVYEQYLDWAKTGASCAA